MTMVRRLLTPIVEVRPDELRTVLLMFAYSFSAMTAYNIVQPVTRSAFISDLGADNLPYALLAAGVLVGLAMQGYGWMVARLPTRWALPLILVAFTGALLLFWLLLLAEVRWASAAFYLFGQIFGTLLLSQFWTLANEIYDPRQARRLFGFIGGGASLGGMAGAGVAALLVGRVGTSSLLPLSAAALVVAVGIAVSIARREPSAQLTSGSADTEAVGLADAWKLLRTSASLKQIALLVSFAAGGAILLDQQLNMAAEQFRGDDPDGITSFLASVRFLLSASALLIQVVLIKQIYRLLGVGVALLILPVTLGLTATLVLVSGALWAPALASVVDRSIRYTVDRTTREIFFLPLAADVRRRAKSFVDVTVDRLARGGAALIVLLLIKPWGLALSWPQLSLITLMLVAAWIAMALRARRRYVSSVKDGFESQAVLPADVGVDVADLTTVETLLEELAHPDEQHVLYAIDVLESLDKQNLVTPLLLRHASPAVRARAVTALGSGRPDIVRRWQALVQKLVDDPDPEVRAKAIVTLATIRNEDAAKVARGLLSPASPRMAASAAVVLAASGRPDDVAAANATLSALASDTRDGSAAVRREVAAAIRQIGDPRCRHLLIPLLQDREPDVAEAAMRSVRSLRPLDDLFVPTLISLLGDRRLKGGARETLISYGDQVLDRLGHALRDEQEDQWVRRHIPATLARIPSQRSLDLLVAVLDTRDRFLRHKALAAIDMLHRRRADLRFSREAIESLLLREARSFFEYLTLSDDLFARGGLPPDRLLAVVLEEKRGRTASRVYRLLALLHPWKEIDAARWAIDRGSRTERAGALEYLDTLLSPALRRFILPMFEELPLDAKARRGHQLLRTHSRSVEDSLLALINHQDEVVAAAAIQLVRDQRQWSLTDDVEHVLAHRDARDWFVFEAASWTLAATRLTMEQQRTRWLEPLPSIVMADRLRHLPMFGALEIEELCRLVSSGRQIRHEDRTVLLQEHVVPEAFHLLIDGRLEVRSKTGSVSHSDAPGLAGFQEALEGRPMAQTCTTIGPVVTLSGTRGDLLTVLTGNTDLVQGLFRTFAEAAGDRMPPVLRGSVPQSVQGATSTLSIVQKVLLLQQVEALAGLPSDELTQLATLTEEVPLEEGTVLSSETDPPIVCVIVRGSLALNDITGSERGRAGPGDAVGLFEALAGSATGAYGRQPLRLVVTDTGVALRLQRDDLYDLIAQRPVLLQHLFGTLFSTAA